MRSTSPARYEDVALPEGLLGEYDADLHLVRLDPRQPSWQYRSTLAHEAAHARHGHRLTGDLRLDAGMERQAEREAACRLIALDDLMDAVAWCESLSEVAYELHVDPALVVARVECLAPEDQEQIVAAWRHRKDAG
jgi:antirestriction protein ArdC